MDIPSNGVIKKSDDSGINIKKEVKMDTNYYIDYRAGLWRAIREKESKTWNFLSFYIAAIAAIGAIGFDKIPFHIIILCILILSAWGLLVIIDSNYWFNRNLKIVTNIEKVIAPEIFEEKIIPQYYKYSHFHYALTYRTLIRVLILIVLASQIWFFYSSSNEIALIKNQWIILFISISVLFLWIYLEDRKRRREYLNFCEKVNDETPDGNKNIKELKDGFVRNNYKGPVGYALSTSILLFSVLAFIKFMLNDNYLWVGYTLIGIIFLLFFTGIFIELIKSKNPRGKKIIKMVNEIINQTQRILLYFVVLIIFVLIMVMFILS